MDCMEGIKLLGSEQVASLTERQAKILSLICKAFIQSGEPIGSRVIRKLGGFKCSPATIRNDMADLEDMGYITSPYTSSGRVPTVKGYKFYVKSIKYPKQLSAKEHLILNMFAHQYDEYLNETKRFFRSIASFTTNITKLPAFVSIPSKSDFKIKKIKIFKVENNRGIATVISDTDDIKMASFTLDKSYSQEIFEKVETFFNNERLNINETAKVFAPYKNFIKSVQKAIDSILKDFAEKEVITEGAMYCFDRIDFKDMNTIKVLMEFLSDRKSLLEVLSDYAKSGAFVSVGIGKESGLNIEDVACVVSSFSDWHGRRGHLGLIGPIRMNYPKIISAVWFISKSLSQLLSNKPVKKMELRRQ